MLKWRGRTIRRYNRKMGWRRYNKGSATKEKKHSTIKGFYRHYSSKNISSFTYVIIVKKRYKFRTIGNK
jgi:hypothetical protein